MAKTVHGDGIYYRSKIAHLEDEKKTGPMKQRYRGKTTGRSRRVQSNPARDYFIHNHNKHCEIINNTLEALEQKENDEIATNERTKGKREK